MKGTIVQVQIGTPRSEQEFRGQLVACVVLAERGNEFGRALLVQPVGRQDMVVDATYVPHLYERCNVLAPWLCLQPLAQPDSPELRKRLGYH